MNIFLSDPRFSGLVPFRTKVWLSSPTMHGDEQRWVDEAIRTNWVSTVGANIDAVEKGVGGVCGREICRRTVLRYRGAASGDQAGW